MVEQSTVTQLADELWQAGTTGVPVEPLSDRYPDLDIDDAYAIQTRVIERRVAAGARPIGRKVGLTSRPMQQLLGVQEPDYGILLAGVLPAIEVVDSRVAGWRIRLVDTVADNASSGLVVLGGRLRAVDELDLRLVGVVVSRNGEVIDTGAGAAALGNPARCVAWLANKLASFGAGLRAGDVVLPGAVHRMVDVVPGDVFRAEFAYLGAVTARFSGAAQSSY